MLRAARKGDDALLRVILAYFEQQGLRIVGAHEVQKNLLAPHGLIAGPAPPADTARTDIETALVIAREIGRLDIGQGAVVCDGLVLAVEAQEGTDAMLERCRLDEALRGAPGARRGVLAKVSKADSVA